MDTASKKYIDTIKNFVTNRPRYKLVVCDENPFSNLEPLNLGYSISVKIKKLQNRSELSYIAPSIVDEVIDDAASCVDGIGDIVILDNWEILFEPELGLIPSDIIMKHAKNKTLVLIWNGKYHSQALSYATDSNCIIDISNINHIAL